MLTYAEPWAAPPAEPTRYYVGADLGQVADYTAVAVVERRPLPVPERALSPAQRLGLAPSPPAHAPDHVSNVVHIERLRNVSYVRQVERVGELLAALRDRRPLRRDPLTRREVVPPPVELVLDRTGVGRGVSDMFADAHLPGVSVTPVTITSGAEAHPSPDGGWFCPKKDLVAAVAIALQARRLRVAPALPLATTLMEELKNFRVVFTATGHVRYEAGGDVLDWRSEAHDDLVLATALPLWWAERSAASAWERLAGPLRESTDGASGGGPWSRRRPGWGGGLRDDREGRTAERRPSRRTGEGARR